MFEQHQQYIGTITTISWYVAGFLAVLKWFELLFLTAQYGNFIAFVLVLFTSTIVTFLWGLYYFVCVFVIIFIISVIPYLVTRGLRK